MMVWKIQPELHMFGKLRCFEVTQVKALMMKLRVLNVEDGFVLRILHHQKHVMWKKQGEDMGTKWDTASDRKPSRSQQRSRGTVVRVQQSTLHCG